MFNGAVGNSEDRSVLNQEHRGGLGRVGRLSLEERQRHGEEHKQGEAWGRFPHCASPCCVVDRPAEFEPPGLIALKSMSRPCTLIEPFMVVPSKVPLKITSVGEPSMGIFSVKLNLSPLR